MAKFIFKMQNILEVKEKLEEQAKGEYAIAIKELELEKEKYHRLEEKRENYEDKLTDLVHDSLRIAEICHMENAVEVMKFRMQEQLKIIQIAERKVENARQKLNNAMVERKTYEKLKEKAFEEFKIEVNSQEKKEIDELVSYKFTQKLKMQEE